MNVVTHFLMEYGLWPKPRLPRATEQRISSELRSAAEDANGLAGDLERIADEADPFGEFAMRARKSRLRRRD